MHLQSGMTAVVTGAGGGIGRSIALEFAARGLNIVVADIEQSAAEAVAVEARHFGAQAVGLAVDVTSQESVTKLADATFNRFGELNVLVNNAGVTLRPFRAAWDTSYEDYKWVMNVNFWGVLHCHQTFVPTMMQQHGVGMHIVNTSSMATTANSAGHSAYNASKAAVDALSLTARKELEQFGIGVSILHPGAIRTRITTSERLRPSTDRSNARYIKPWSEYATRIEDPLVDTKPEDAVEPEHDPAVPNEWFQYITPEATGWLVAEGIGKNLPHIVTHPWPIEKIQVRADDLIRGLPEYSGWTPSRTATV